jgi:uncharacterized protein (UPF0335 family)
MTDMTHEEIAAIGDNAAKVLRELIEAWEKLDEEKADIAEGQKNVMSQLKAAGFDTKVVRKLIQLRKMDADERNELTQLLELYSNCIGMN